MSSKKLCYIALAMVLVSGIAMAADNDLTDCKMPDGDHIKATAAVCRKLGGQPVTKDTSPSVATLSADLLFATWEEKNRTEHEIAYKAAREFLDNYSGDARAAKVQSWVTSFEKVVGPEAAALLKNAVSIAVFRDCPECPEMVAIPAGSFEMGSPSYEVGRQDCEGPVHRVHVPAFSLAKTHITRGQFAAFVNDTDYDAGNKCSTFEGGKWEMRSGRNWRDPGFKQEDSHPVVCVNWEDAKAYAAWLSRKTGKSYRLPSEAEWEYAARAGTTTARYWGDSPNEACSYANVLDNQALTQFGGAAAGAHNCSDGYVYTAPVASFKPNAFGLYDMIGNAWEWVEDCWNQLNKSYAGAPIDGSAWTTGPCQARVLRGGSYNVVPPQSRAAFRGANLPDFRGFHAGFRLARMP